MKQFVTCTVGIYEAMNHNCKNENDKVLSLI